MKLSFTFRIGHDAFEDFKNRELFHFEAGFFADFTPDTVLQFFAGLDDPAGQRPIALERFLRALDQEDFTVVEDERADPKERARWIAPALCVNTERSLSHPAARDTPSFAQ
jgi:hypothetical protein